MAPRGKKARPPSDVDELLRLRIRIEARAVQLSRSYRRLYVFLSRVPAAKRSLESLRRSPPGFNNRERLQDGFTLHDIPPLGLVGLLDPDDRADLDLSALELPSHRLEALVVLGLDASNEPEHHPEGATEREDGVWELPVPVGSDPLVRVQIDLGRPRAELILALEELRRIRGVKVSTRSQRAREWAGDEGWEAAFRLLEYRRANPGSPLGQVAHHMWPHRGADRAARQQASRLIAAAEAEVRRADDNVRRAVSNWRAWRRRQRHVRRVGGAR